MGRSRFLGAVATVTIAALLGACSTSTPTESTTGSTLSPLTVPSTTIAPGSTEVAPDRTVDTISPDTLPPDRISPSSVLASLSVGQSGRCAAGRGRILVSHDPSASTVLRLVTAIIDGVQVSSDLPDGSAQFEVTDVACDGSIHTVLIVIIAEDGSTQSRSFAIRMTP